jgi:very-short-patch-repair endonuclease
VEVDGGKRGQDKVGHDAARATFILRGFVDLRLIRWERKSP